jgi:aspartyl-tRNA synthetase
VLQVVFNPDVSGDDAHIFAHSLRSEYVISVSGEIRKRPAGTENPNMPTGTIEMYAAGLQVLNESSPLPFMFVDACVGGTELHRYQFESRCQKFHYQT